MISMNKKYKTRSGQSVRVLCVDRPDAKYPVIALVGDHGSVETFSIEGTYCPDVGSGELDLIEVPPCADFKIDDPVMVRDEYKWYRRHFAGVSEDGFPLAFYQGTTSFTRPYNALLPEQWKECRRPTDEEMKGVK